MLRTTTIGITFIFLVIVWGCRDVYVSPYKSPPTGYLVVEGYISGNSVTQFTLTRTVPLPGDPTIPTVDGATVQVEGSDNSIYPLTDLGGGIYSSIDTLNLNPQLRYRLRIQTTNDQYLSDLVPYKSTPPIDSINWVQDGTRQVRIYANTHNPADTTGYYRWDFTQIYEHDAGEDGVFYYDKDTVPKMVLARSPSMLTYRCWTTSSSTSIIIANTTKLSSDVIYEQPVKTIPPDDIQLSVLYTILVRQYAITADAYAFLNLMQQNTESLGSIFDAQPSQITGNIHSLTNAGEKIIGYVSAGTVQQQRIWIQRYQVLDAYSDPCPIKDTIIGNDSASLWNAFGQGPFSPLVQGPSCGNCWLSNYKDCQDCREQGGVTQKPIIWPN
ncbi:MAG TPA: DUF4249 domain-containing protein [Puia sp.]|nr:DUF4249 domain-containing protein [Puia sp.]